MQQIYYNLNMATSSEKRSPENLSKLLFFMLMTVVVAVPHESEGHGQLHETLGHITSTSSEHGAEREEHKEIKGICSSCS